MFRISKATTDDTERLLAAARDAPPSTPHLLTLRDGPLDTPPTGFAHDRSHSHIGHGERAFAAARDAFRNWEQFNLGWVHVASPLPKVVPGEVVAVEAHTAHLWSMNISRITEVVDNSTRFGFLYSTTACHVEEGQERFVLDFDPESKSVSYFDRSHIPPAAYPRPHRLSILAGHAAPLRQRFAQANERLSPG